MRRIQNGILIIMVLAGLAGCSSSSSGGGGTVGTDASNSTDQTKPQGGLETLKGVLAAQGIELIDSVTYPDMATGKSYTGYLGKYTGKTSCGCDKKNLRPKADNIDANGNPIDTEDMTKWECKKKVAGKAELEDAWVKNAPKYCLVLTGTPTSMGFQEGYLRPMSVERMTSSYIKEALFDQFSLLGLSIDTTDPITDEVFLWFYANIESMIKAEIKKSEANPDDPSVIPPMIFDEIRGITEGANAALRKMDRPERVDLYETMAISEGMDALFCFLAKFLFNGPPDIETLAQIDDLLAILLSHGGKKMLNGNFGTDEIQVTPDKKLVFPKMLKNADPNWAFPFPKVGCNAFMLTGKATADGKTYHGRDFMFATGGVFQDEACMMIYLPEAKYGYPFATVSVPGFVGLTVGMNSEGLSAGCDVSLSDKFAKDVGVGVLIINRLFVQQCATIDQAVQRFRELDRGMPWDIIVADDETSAKYGNGIVLEAGRSDDPAFSGYDTLLPTTQLALLPEILKLSKTEAQNADDLNAGKTVKNGIMVRGATWKFPAEFKVAIPDDKRPDVNDRATYMKWYGPKGGDDGQSLTFPDPGEDDDDIVVASNHYIIPRMRMTQFTPIVQFGYTRGALPESVWRYDFMLKLIQDNYGTIDFWGPNPDYPAEGSAGWIIDFLNPRNNRGDKLYKKDFYPATFSNVEGLHAVMANTDREIKGLFGYFSDPWVGIKMRPFLDWYYPKKG